MQRYIYFIGSFNSQKNALRRGEFIFFFHWFFPPWISLARTFLRRNICYIYHIIQYLITSISHRCSFPAHYIPLLMTLIFFLSQINLLLHINFYVAFICCRFCWWKTFVSLLSRGGFRSSSLCLLRIFCVIFPHTHSQFPPFIIKNISWGFLSHSFVLTLYAFFVSHFFIIMIFLRFVFALCRHSENDFFASRKVPFIAVCLRALIISSNVIFWQLNQLHTYMRVYDYGFANGEKNENTQSQLKLVWLCFQPFFIFRFFLFYFVCSRNNFYLYSIVVLYA